VKFRIENKIEAPLQKVESSMFSEEYMKFLEKSHQGVKRIELIEQKEENGKIRRTIKYTPKPIIERVGPKKVPESALVFTEHSTYDLNKHILEFENIPAMNLVRERFRNTGTILFEEREGYTNRILEGELSVRFPILGSIAEKIIFTQAKKLLQQEIECFKQYVKSF